MSEKPRYDDVIHHIYTAATSPEHWPYVLEQLSQNIGAIGANLHILNGQEHFGEISLTNYVDSGDMTRWNREIAGICPWNEAVLSRSIGEVYLSEDLVPERQFLESEAFQEFYHRQGCYHGVGSYFAKFGDRVGIIGMNRTRACGAFGEEHREQLNYFLPHLNRAFLIQEKIASIEAKYASATGALDHLSMGVALLDDQSRIILANKKMESYFSDKLLRARNNKFVMPTPKYQDCLKRLVVECSTTGAGGHSPGGGFTVSTFQHDNLEKLYIAVFPYRESFRQAKELHGKPRVIVFVSQANPVLLPKEILAGMFRLSGKESDVLDLLLQDKTLEEIGELLLVSKETVRFHLKNTFLKTETRRQAQLVNLCRSVVGASAINVE